MENPEAEVVPPGKSFRAVSFEDIARIADKTETVAAAQGEVLFGGGESITHVYVVRSGPHTGTSPESLVAAR